MRPMRIRPIRFSLVLVAGFVFASLQPALATTLQDLRLDEMVAASDDIVVGTCEKSESVWIGKKIYTVATIRVSQTAKGNAAPGKTITVHNLGGRVTAPLPVEMYVEGATQMLAGEEMVLFLEKYGDKKQFHRTVGMAQGKLAITADQKTGEKVVNYRQPIKGVKWVDAQGKPVDANVKGVREEPADARTLEGFLGRIHKIKAEQEAKTKPQADAPYGQKGAP